MVVIKRVGFPARTQRIEVKIGPSPKSMTAKYWLWRILSNTRCGAISGTGSSPIATFTCSTPLTGQHMTLQTVEEMQMNIAEVNIYQRGGVNCPQTISHAGIGERHRGCYQETVGSIPIAPHFLFAFLYFVRFGTQFLPFPPANLPNTSRVERWVICGM